MEAFFCLIKMLQNIAKINDNCYHLQQLASCLENNGIYGVLSSSPANFLIYLYLPNK